MIDTTDTEAIVAKLNKLIELDYDAIAAYQQAVERLDNVEFCETLAIFKNDHHRHVEVLGTLVKTLQGTPPTGGDAKRLLTQGKVMLAELTGDKAILKAMRSNEEQTNKAYAEALEEFADSSEIQATLRRNFDDEKKHKAWMENALLQYFD